MRRAIGIIPVRMASERFPGKPLAPIAGRPMLRHVWDALSKSRLITFRYVATADTEVIDYCERHGLEYIITRADCRNGTERVADAVQRLSNREDDIVVNIQGDEPLVRPESLDELARQFIDPRVNVASLYFKPESNRFFADPNRVKVLIGGEGYALAFTRRPAAPGLWPLYGQHIGVYAYRRDLLNKLVKLAPVGDLEQTAWMRQRVQVRMVKVDYETHAVDQPGDIDEAERRLVSKSVSRPEPPKAADLHE